MFNELLLAGYTYKISKKGNHYCWRTPEGETFNRGGGWLPITQSIRYVHMCFLARSED
jgi:hypothetical protein